MQTTGPLLTVSNLRCDFKIHKKMVHAVRGVDLSIHEGEVLGVVGESGSGKSVTMKSIIRILPDSAVVTADALSFAGEDLTHLSEKQYRHIRGNAISMIFQDPMTSLNPLKRVGDHIVEVLQRHRHMDKKEAEAEAIEMLRKVGVPSPEQRVKQYPHEFSGGMRQRALIAMALACNPKMLIADEPTTALDVTIQAQILDLIRELQRENGMTVVLITHDLGVVASMCDRIAVMYCGLIMEQGTTDEIFYEPKHPYTKALLRSVPAINEETSERLKPIEGQAPSVANPPPGCPFAPRCPIARPSCSEAIPDMVAYGEGHIARCPYGEEEA